jgi:hypothetical protein
VAILKAEAAGVASEGSTAATWPLLQGGLNRIRETPHWRTRIVSQGILYTSGAKLKVDLYQSATSVWVESSPVISVHTQCACLVSLQMGSIN